MKSWDILPENQISADFMYIESISKIPKVQICKNITTISVIQKYGYVGGIQGFRFEK
jgi:hypothetical protein